MTALPQIVTMLTDGAELSRDEEEFFVVLQDCWNKFVQRNRERHGVWRNSGIKGQMEEVFAKAERAFVQVFQVGEVPDRDHFEDCINYSVFALMLLNEAEKEGQLPMQVLNGYWPW